MIPAFPSFPFALNINIFRLFTGAEGKASTAQKSLKINEGFPKIRVFVLMLKK